MMTLHNEIRLSQILGGITVLAGTGVLLYLVIAYRFAIPDQGALGIAMASGFLLLIGIVGLAMGRMLSVFQSSTQHVRLSEALGIVLVLLGLAVVVVVAWRAWPDPPTLRQLAGVLAGMFSGTAGVVILLAERVKFYERTLLRR